MSGFLGVLLAIRTFGSAIVRITNRVLSRVPHDNINDILTVNGITIMVSSTGRLSYSDDNINFISVDTPAPNAKSNLYRIKYVNNKWWALGTNSFAMASDDGLTWEQVNVTASTGRTFNSIAWNGSAYVISDANNLHRSTDGITWTPITISGYVNYASVMVVGTTFFVTLSPTGSSDTAIGLSYSNDGSSWATYRTIGNGVNVSPLTTRLLNNGSYSVMTFGEGVIYASLDNSALSTWSIRGNPADTANAVITDIRWVNDRWVAAYGSVMTSTDRVTWTAVSQTNSYGASGWVRLSYTGTGTRIIKTTSSGGIQLTDDYGRTVITAISDVTSTGHPLNTTSVTPYRPSYVNSRYFLPVNGTGYIFTSTDDSLQLWSSSIIGTSQTMYNGVSWNGSVYVGSGPSGYLYYSNDGITWTTVTSGSTTDVYTAAGDGVFVMASGSGLIKTSTNGVTWTTRTATGFTAPATSVTWNGSQFLVTGSGMTAISLDSGTTWTKYSVTGLSPGSVVWSGAQYVAVGNSGSIKTSPDGINWTSQTSGVTYHLNSIAYSGSVYVVTTATVNPKILFSYDSVTWTEISGPTARAMTGGVSYVNGKFVLCAGYCSMYTSTNGVNWQPIKIALRSVSTLAGAETGMSNSIIVHDSTNINVTSDAGSTWTQYALGPTMTIGGQVIYANGMYAACSSTNGVIYRSTDGVNWQTSTLPNTSFTVDGIAYNGSMWVATQGWGWNQTGSYRFAFYSYDLVTWYYTTGVTSFGCGPIKWLNDRFITLVYGTQPTYRIHYSTDGINWAATASQSTNKYNDMAYGNGMWVLIGSGGYITTSNDCVTWSVRTSGTTSQLYGIAFNGTYFLAVGASGTAIMSSDGANWFSVSSGTGMTYNAVAWDENDGAFVLITSTGGTSKVYPN